MKINPINVNNRQNNNKKEINVQKSSAEIYNKKINVTSPINRYPIGDYKYILSFGAKDNINQVNRGWYKLPVNCRPDEFQISAGKVISSNKNVLVEAPTGTGKTAIAHYVIGKNLKEGKKTFYTTPLKALSNQKLNEFKSIYGENKVGILTGDRRENIEAPILIMTTEVYRNMALTNAYGMPVDIMQNVGSVIFDEFHYLGDTSRGANWEESIILAPQDVQLTGLSATIGNPEKITKWLNELKDKKTELVTMPSEKRYVPLKYDIIKTAGYYSSINKQKNARVNNKKAQQTDNKPTLSDYNNAVKKLDSKEQLPAIFFVFSKKFSRELIDYFSNFGEDLTTKSEKKEIEEILNKYKENKYIGAGLNTTALKKGYALHNAGIIPEQKVLIEELFQKKLLKVVIATETLAAGINMPAKTVLISSPYKPCDRVNGELARRCLSVNEYNQMAGRAGRRGIDETGYVYSLASDTETERVYNYLQKAEFEDVESNFNPGYSFLAGYYEYNDDSERLNELFDDTLYVKGSEDKAKRKQELIEVSKNKRNVLLRLGYLSKEGGKIYIEPKGKMLSVLRGYNPIAMVELAEDRELSEISPISLVYLMAGIANPLEGKEKSNEPNDQSDIFVRTYNSVNKIYQMQINLLRTKLQSLGKDIKDFGSYEEIAEYADSIKIEGDSSKLREKLSELNAVRKNLKVIQSNSGYYSPMDVVKAFERGSKIPTKVLERYNTIIEEYKLRHNCKDIREVIEKYEKELKEASLAPKGAKAKARANKKAQDIIENLNIAKAYKYLDGKIFNEIGNNYTYTKKNILNEVENEYGECRKQYIEITASGCIKKAVKSIKEIERYKSEKGIKEGIEEEKYKTNEIENKLNEKIFKIYLTEMEEGIENEPLILGRTMAEKVYEWAYLNSINPDSMINWKYIISEGEDNTADEGSIYRAVLQTNDILSQLTDMAIEGYRSAETSEDRMYYKRIINNTVTARNMLIREPINTG